MKKLFLFLAFAGVMPLSALGQDDVYFTPAKSVSKTPGKILRPIIGVVIGV